MPYKKEAKVKWWRESLKKKRQAAIDAYGGKCQRCGFSDIRALQFDHVKGDGKIELRRVTNRRTYYRIVVEQVASGKYQLLCANCNWIKRAENQEHT